MKRIATLTAMLVVFALLLAACGGGVVDDGPLADDNDTEPTTEAPVEEPSDTDEVTDETDTTEAATTEPADESMEPEPTEAPSEDPAAEPAETEAEPVDEVAMSDVTLYYLAPGGEESHRPGPFLIAVHREIPSTPRIALATLRELFAGPSASDEALVDGIATAVPDNALVLDVAITDGLATVDLSREFESGGGSLSMFARLAQVVYTVSQWPTVDEVAFELDGQPVTVFSGEGIEIDEPSARDDFVDLLPRVFVDAPAAGAELRSGDRVTGVAAVFEGTFLYRLTDADGEVLAEGFESTDNGMGWGAFDWALTFDVGERQQGSLTVWESSAKDGSDQAVRVTPVVLVP
jgi:germination protein M